MRPKPKTEIAALLPAATMELLTLAGHSSPVAETSGVRTERRLKGHEIDMIFADFQVLDQHLDEAFKAARQFCRDMASGTEPAYWLTLLGSSGTGKTMLARRISRFFSKYLDCLVDECSGRNERWIRKGGFKSWPDAVAEMISGDYSGIKQLRDDWFICLDDIAAENSRVRELSASKLYEVLNARRGRFTVITANCSLAEISDRLDARISSRLLRDKSPVIEFPKEVPDFSDR